MAAIGSGPTLRSGRELMQIVNYSRSRLVHALAHRLVFKLLVCLDQWGNENTMFITADWFVPQAKRYAEELGWTPLYIVNVWSKPNGR